MKETINDINTILRIVVSINNSVVESMSCPHWSKGFQLENIFEKVELFSKKYTCDISLFNKDQLIMIGFKPYEDLLLIPIYLTKLLDPEMKVISIFNEEKVIKDVNLDIRGGCIAYGIKLS